MPMQENESSRWRDVIANTRDACATLLTFLVLKETVQAVATSRVERRTAGRLFDDGHVDGVVREQDFADVAEQDVDSLFAVDFLVAVHRDHDGGVKLRVDEATVIMALSGYSVGRSETLKKFHSHVLPLSGEKA
jgi:hypothetical protein